MNDLPTRRAFARAGAAEINRTIDAALDELQREQAERHAAIRAKAADEESSRHHYTREEVVGARAVRDRFGWHKVARVNAKTVSVETGYSWADRIEFDRILEVLA